MHFTVVKGVFGEMSFSRFCYFLKESWNLTKYMNSLYKMVSGFSFVLMKLILCHLAVSLFFLLALSCSNEAQNPEGSEGNDSGLTRNPVSSGPPPAPYVLNVPIFESNYTGEPLNPSSSVSIAQASWEELIKYNEENQGFDSRTGNFLEGKVKVYDENGQVSGIYNYRNGLLHGPSEEYHANGIVSLSNNYLDGKKHGKEEWFSDNGSPTYEANFKEDVMDGVEIIWSEEGTPTETLYSNGEVVKEEEGVPVETPLEDEELDLDPVEEEPEPDPDF